MDHDYELEDDYAPRILWGRLAFFLLAIVLAFAVGRCTKASGVDEDLFQAEKDKVQELASNNAVLQQQLDAATSEQGNQGGGNNDGGGNNEQPADGASEAASDEPIADGQTYTVQPGDTLTTIAQKFYGDPTKFDLIVDANNLSEDTPLRVGQELVIPPEP